MRLSSDPADPGYQTAMKINEAGQRAVVFFNGDRQLSCIMADDGLGEIVRFKRSSTGGFVFDPGRPDRFVTEKLVGRVRIAIVRPPINANALRSGVPAA